MEVIMIVSIIAAALLINILPVKGWNIVVVAFVLTLLVALANSLPIDAVTGVMMGGMGGMLAALLPLFVFGGILGTIYNHSNAARSLARLILRPFKNAKSTSTRVFGVILLLLVVRAIIGLSGFNNIAIMPLMIAIVTMIFKATDIPRKYVNCALLISGEIQILVPGAPTSEMVMLEQYLTGFTRMSYFVPRLIVLIVYTIAAALILSRLMVKDMEKGMTFDPGPLQVDDVYAENVKCPPVLLTIVPLVLIWILFSIVGWEPWIALLIGCIVAIVLMWPWLEVPEGMTKYKMLLVCMDEGTFKLPLTITGVALFGMVVTATPGWTIIQNAVSALPIHPAILLTVASIILVFVGGTTGMIPVIASLALGTCVAGGMSVGACGVIALLSFVCLDTVPNNLGLIMQCNLTATPVKEAYPSVFRTTVLLTTGITIVVMLCNIIGILP